ncbi:MAG: hypothetical protein WDN04_12115 [Rhodospirillales bacterium]
MRRSWSRPAAAARFRQSWGGKESKGEEKFEQDFAKPGVVFFASAGDSPGTIFPSVMSKVVSVGGTQISRTTTAITSRS